MRNVEGKNILITGASKGLGRQLALDLAREGAAAIALVARHADMLYKVREEIRDIAPRTKVFALPADLRHSTAVERVSAAALSEFQGRLDVLINNASALGPSPMPYLLVTPALPVIRAGARAASPSSDWKASPRPGPPNSPIPASA